jgi:uncharacterized protein YdaU (DUF1376 family)
VADSQSYQKLGYYAYYPADFEQGTAAFTLSEVGAYQRLLNYQWTNGSVPGDSVKSLASILRCTPSTAKSVWAVIGSKFPKMEDGQHRNHRLALVRQDAEILYDKNCANGAKGGRPKKPNHNPPVMKSVTQTEPKPNPDERQSKSKSYSDTSVKNTDVPRVASALVMNPLQFEKLREKNAFVGARLRVPHVLHDELRNKLGGEEPHSRLVAWYGELDEALEASGEPVLDVFLWLRPKFVAWAQASVDEAGRGELLASLKAMEAGHGR